MIWNKVANPRLRKGLSHLRNTAIFAAATFGFGLLPGNPDIGFRPTSGHREIEAKSQLTGIYVAEKAFWSEYSTFVSSLPHIGYQPDGEIHYVIGFPSTCALPNASSPFASGKAEPIRNYFEYKSQPELFRLVVNAEALPEIKKQFESLPCHPDFPKHFFAYAVGDLGASPVDIWRIDDAKQLTHVQAGGKANSRAENRALNVSLLGSIGLFLCTLATISSLILALIEFVRALVQR